MVARFPFSVVHNIKRADTIKNTAASGGKRRYFRPYFYSASSLPSALQASIASSSGASQQVTLGQNYSFLEEAMPGDLAFFGDETGAITHVGIIWEQNRIIHASGRVRVDKIDHQGIFNEDLKRYTHNLKVIKRILND